MTTINRLLVVTPHSSGALPANILRDMLGDDIFNTQKREAFLNRIFLDGDAYTDLIYQLPEADFLPAAWSRFAVDLNRDKSDGDDNGVIKLTDFDRQLLYPDSFRLKISERVARLDDIWDIFYNKLKEKANKARLVIVGHSMAAFGPKLGPDTGAPRPAICLMLGTKNSPTVPHVLWNEIKGACEESFSEVIASSDFSGVEVGNPWNTDTISKYCAGELGIPAFGIEINCGLILKNGSPIDGLHSELHKSFKHFTNKVLDLVE